MWPCDCLFKTRQQHQGEEMKTEAEVCDLVGNTKTNYAKVAYLYITPSAIIITSPSPGAPSPTLTSWSGRHRQVDNPLVVWCLPTTSRCEPLVSDVTWRGTDHCLVSVWTGDYVWWWTLSASLMLVIGGKYSVDDRVFNRCHRWSEIAVVKYHLIISVYEYIKLSSIKSR